MAFTGVHITFSDMAQGVVQSGELLPYRANGSQSMTSPATSTVKAIGHGIAPALLSISSTVGPIFYATGSNPNPNGSPRRYYDPQWGREDIFVDDGDLFAWVLA